MQGDRAACGLLPAISADLSRQRWAQPRPAPLSGTSNIPQSARPAPARSGGVCGPEPQTTSSAATQRLNK